MEQNPLQNNDRSNLPDEIDQLAFDKKQGEPFTESELAIINEWDSGKATDLMKISTADPKLLNYLTFHNTLEKKKAALWANTSKWRY